MKLFGVFLGCLAWAPVAMAGVTAFDYRLGETRATEDQQKIVLHAQEPVIVAILPGGKSWPALSLDEAGRIYVGGIVIEAATGRRLAQTEATLALPHGVAVTAVAEGYRFERGGHACRLSLQQLQLDERKTALDTLKDANLSFAGANGTLLALATRFAPDGTVGDYLVERIDLDRCEVAIERKLGNPDLLVEIMHSQRGGWWITGSVEQTLLRSSDGKRWRKVRLPPGLSSLVSSYIAGKDEIWLAAVLADDAAPSPYLMVYSGDGGKHWRNVVADDPLLAKVPAAWLEGQKRRVPQDAP
jgi:hypothetical protein